MASFVQILLGGIRLGLKPFDGASCGELGSFRRFAFWLGVRSDRWTQVEFGAEAGAGLLGRRRCLWRKLAQTSANWSRVWVRLPAIPGP